MATATRTDKIKHNKLRSKENPSGKSDHATRTIAIGDDIILDVPDFGGRGGGCAGGGSPGETGSAAIPVKRRNPKPK